MNHRQREGKVKNICRNPEYLECACSEHTVWDAIRTHSFADIHPSEGSDYIRDGNEECTHLVCFSLSLSGREAVMFKVAGLFPLKPLMLLMPCHMPLVLLVLNCSSTLFLYCRLAALMDFLRS